MEQTIIIRNAAMIDGVSDQLVPKVNVLIKDSLISAISIEEDVIETWKADAQENATVVDAPENTCCLALWIAIFMFRGMQEQNW